MLQLSEGVRHPETRSQVASPGVTVPRRRPRSPYAYLVPAAILIYGLIYFSIGYTVWASTVSWNGISGEPVPVGFANYLRALSDPEFWATLLHMALLAIGIPISMALGLLFATILASSVRLRSLYRAVFFVPVVLSAAVMAPVFRSMFDVDGLVNQILRSIGVGFLAHPWLADPATALWTLLAITVWTSTGFCMVIYSAGLTQLEPSVFEAARLDGAGPIRTLVSIIVPLTRSSSVALLILSTIGLLKTFDVPFLVTSGGPAQSTQVLGTYLYQEGITDFKVGYGSALTVLMLVLSVGLTIAMVIRYRREGQN